MVPRTTISVAADNSGGVQESGAARGRSGLLQVWLVDDSENFRSLLAALLEEEGELECGRQFPTAEAVIAALEKETPPDVILLDIRMPGMGGVAAVRPIKSLAPGTHVLMLTTFFDAQAKGQALRDGAADLLLKSYHVDEIAQRIREVCSHPERFPKIPSLEPAVSVTSSWPDRRTPEVQHGRLNSPEGEPQPERGRRNGFGQCASNRLVRGVNYLRSLIKAIGKHREESSPEATLSVEAPGR
jgi:CheY-like chemotaxis protein